jgi:hypothetical protein
MGEANAAFSKKVIIVTCTHRMFNNDDGVGLGNSHYDVQPNYSQGAVCFRTVHHIGNGLRGDAKCLNVFILCAPYLDISVFNVLLLCHSANFAHYATILSSYYAFRTRWLSSTA